MSFRRVGFDRWRLRCDIVLRRYSAWPLISLAGMVAIAVALLATSKDLRDQIEAHQAALGRHETARLASAGASAAQPAPANLQTTPPVWRVVPSVERHSDDLKQLFAIARQRGLLLAQGEYVKSPDSAPQVEGMQIQLPLSGTYPQLRSFVEDALRRMPHLSIDEIGFERSAAADPLIAARVRLTLWYRNSQPPTVGRSQAAPKGGEAR